MRRVKLYGQLHNHVRLLYDSINGGLALAVIAIHPIHNFCPAFRQFTPNASHPSPHHATHTV